MKLIYKIKLLIYLVISIILVAIIVYGYKKVKSFLEDLFSKTSISSSILPNQSGGGLNSSGGSSW